MKNISAARREQEAALARGQERAEAEAAGKKPQGEGVAAHRKAIIERRSESVEGFPTTAVGSSPHEVTSLAHRVSRHLEGYRRLREDQHAHASAQTPTPRLREKRFRAFGE